MTSKASRLAAFMAVANTQALVSVPSSEQIANTFLPKTDPTITGTLAANNVTVAGNLTVSGTTTYINTSELNIADNIITLNSDVTGTPTENAGLLVQRGTSANVAILWDESIDKWVVTNDGSTYANVGGAAGATLIANTTDTQAFYLPMSNASSGAWSNAVVATTLSYKPSTSTLTLSANATVNAIANSSMLRVANGALNTSITPLGIQINGSYGTSGQVLKSRGSNTQWVSLTSSDVGLGSVPNVDCTNAYNITGGAISTYILAPNGGQANSTTFLCGDQTWKTVSVPSPTFSSLSGLALANTASGDVISYSVASVLVPEQNFGQGTHWNYYGAQWYSYTPLMEFPNPSPQLVTALTGMTAGQQFTAYDENWSPNTITLAATPSYNTNGPQPMLYVSTTTSAATWKNSLTIQSIVIPQYMAQVGQWGNANTSTAGIHTSSLGVGTDAPNYQTNPGEIRATGNIGAFYSSDERLKENIKDIENALEIVSAIGSQTFDWTDDYIEKRGGEDGYFVQKHDFGVVAQRVQKVFPAAVRTRPDGTLAVDYEKLSTLAFGAIGQLLKRVEALESNNNK